MDFIIIKTLYSENDTIKKMERKPQTGRKYLQNPHLIKDIQNIWSNFKTHKLKKKLTKQLKNGE